MRQAVPIIAVSTSHFKEAELDNRLANFNAFLPKPIELNLLLQQIGHLLALRWRYETP